MLYRLCVGFCQTSTWISHRYTYVPSLFIFFTYNISICLCCCYNFSAKTPCSYSCFLFIFSVNTLIYLHGYFLKTIFFLAVLGLQHNWEECTEISNVSLCPKPWRTSLIISTLTRVTLTFVITGEPTLTHHNHLKSIIYITVHSWCCIIFYSFRLMYNTMDLSLGIIEYFYCPKNTLLCLLIPLTAKPWQYQIFSLSP